MKFIIFTDKSDNHYPIIFPNYLKHINITKKIKHKPLAGGFCKIIDGKFRCYGKSVSLNLGWNQSDENMLNFLTEKL